MFHRIHQEPKFRTVTRSCPNARADGTPTACNCIGACQPIQVALDDPRTDDEIREAHRRPATRYSNLAYGGPDQEPGAYEE